MVAAISTRNLSKDYGRIHALRNVNLEIPAGRITGLMGPNGAGKSTLIKSLVGSLNLISGEIRVLDQDPIKQARILRKKIGYMPQEPALYMDLSARENVNFYARLHRLKNIRYHTEQLLTELDLGDRLDSPVYTLSGGMQKRVSLACAMVHDPELFILDEPTAALDPLLKRYLWKKFKELVAKGKTLLISTHLMDEAMLCDYVVLLRKGQVIADDAPRRLIATGNAVLHYYSQSRGWTETVPAEGRALARALQRHGLSKDITRLDIDIGNLEDIMVERLKSKGKERV